MKLFKAITCTVLLLTGMGNIVRADLTNPGLAAIAEFSDYQVVLIRDHFDASQTDSSAAGTSAWYTTDNRSSINAYQRIGYYLEVVTGTGAAAQTEWVFVTMPDYTGGDLS